MKKKDLQRAENIVFNVIRHNDPLGLCSHGEGDELMREVRSIARQVDRIHSISDASFVLVNVFSSSFGREEVASLDFQSYGRELFYALVQAGFCK